MIFGENALSDTLFSKLSLDHFYEGGAKTEFYFSSRTEFLSIFEVSFVERTLLQDDSTTIELPKQVKLSHIVPVESVFVHRDRLSVRPKLSLLVMKSLFKTSQRFRKKRNHIPMKSQQLCMLGSQISLKQPYRVRDIREFSTLLILFLQF